MKTKLVVFLVVMATAAIICDAGTVPYQHAYYLSLKGPEDNCADCYIPLLLTKEPIESINDVQPIKNPILVITYERDSIWEVKNEGVSIGPGAIQLRERIINIDNREYRFQAVGKNEVLKLLRKPDGSIPIHRLHLPGKVSQKRLIESLIRDFEGQPQ